MINLKNGKTNVVENEESNVLNEDRTSSDSLPINHIPSYVGLSCAVSGYRSINKYDGAVREHSSANLTPSLNLFCGHCKDRPSNFDNEYSENSIPNTSSYVITKEGLPSVNNVENIMNISSSKESFSSHKFVSLEQVTNLNSSNSIQITTKSLSCFTQGVDDQNNGKSFVQQRIERLYGPSALGIGFQARRSFLERLRDEERKEGKDEPNNLSTMENSREFPSVFRHLRPEFRHQLPVRSKLIYPRESNGFLDKTDTNCTNGLNSREANKTWKSLSKELESVCKVVETDSLNAKPVNSLRSSSIECQNNESTKTSSKLKETTNIQDGNYYLKIVALEVAVFEPEIEKIENDLKLQENLMSEEVKGKLLAASGKAKLLINQKVEQFKGLCFKNITNSSSDEFATTNEDLAGFWDMVKIQVENVKDLFKEVDELRCNNWKIKDQVTKISDSLPVKKCNTTKKLKSSGADISKNATKAVKLDSIGDERRKQMREALNAKRKQAMKMKNSNKTESDIEIFIHSK